jgi:SAM-dependent methyltransferase
LIDYIAIWALETRETDRALMSSLAYFPRPLATLAPRDLLLLERLALRSTDTALEIGTGSGSSLFRLAGSVATLHGVDVAPGPVERIRRVLTGSNKAAFRTTEVFVLDFCEVGAARSLPRRYDVIFSCDTVEHVPDPAAFFVNVYDALEPGGRVFITYPNEHPRHAHGITYFESRLELEQLMCAAGFSSERIEIRTLRMGKLAERVMQMGWLLPRAIAKKAWGLLTAKRSRHLPGNAHRENAPQTFDETDFFAAADRLEPMAPLINAYCWAVMELMSLAEPVHAELPAPEIIWDTRILIRASR